MNTFASKVLIAQRALTVFFAPAVKLMGRVSFVWKFVLTGVLFLAPLSLVMFHYVVGLGEQIEFSRREVGGARLLNNARQLMLHIALSEDPGKTRTEGALPSQAAHAAWFDQLESMTDTMLTFDDGLQPMDQIPLALRSFRSELRQTRE